VSLNNRDVVVDFKGLVIVNDSGLPPLGRVVMNATDLGGGYVSLSYQGKVLGIDEHEHGWWRDAVAGPHEKFSLRDEPGGQVTTVWPIAGVAWSFECEVRPA
jgi:hypothetical protein